MPMSSVTNDEYAVVEITLSTQHEQNTDGIKTKSSKLLVLREIPVFKAEIALLALTP